MCTSLQVLKHDEKPIKWWTSQQKRLPIQHDHKIDTVTWQIARNKSKQPSIILLKGLREFLKVWAELWSSNEEGRGSSIWFHLNWDGRGLVCQKAPRFSDFRTEPELCLVLDLSLIPHNPSQQLEDHSVSNHFVCWVPFKSGLADAKLGFYVCFIELNL